MARLTRKMIEAALMETFGNVALSARRLGVSREYLSRTITKTPALKVILNSAREERVDHAESALSRAVINGEAWAVCFTLKTLGKSRGYVERVQQEISGRDGQAIEIKPTVFDHSAAVASLAARSAEHYREPGEVQNRGDGETLG
jgi:hypothetical protein